MTHHQRMDAFRSALSELGQAQMTAAFCLGRLEELVTVDDPADLHNTSLPRVEDGTYSVCWRRQKCRLGCTTSFRLFARLLRRANQYVTYDQLKRDVWADRVVSDDTIRSAIRLLKQKLNAAKMRRLATSIEGHGKQYVLHVSRN